VARVTGGDKFFYLQYLFLNRFGSVRVNRFLHYKTENRTEPRFFLTILIGFFSRFGFFSFFRFYRFIRFSGFFAHP
jgi:hypothetical protein